MLRSLDVKLGVLLSASCIQHDCGRLRGHPDELILGHPMFFAVGAYNRYRCIRESSSKWNGGIWQIVNVETIYQRWNVRIIPTRVIRVIPMDEENRFWMIDPLSR